MKILLISEVGWGFLRQRHHEVALHFASKGYEVKFIGPTLFRLPKAKRLINKLAYALKKSSVTNTSHVIGGVNAPYNLSLGKSFIIPSKFFNLWNFIYSKYILNVEKYDLIYSFTPSIIFIVHKRSIWKHVVFDIIHNWWEIPKKPINFDYNLRCVLQNTGGLITDSLDVLNKLESEISDKPKYLMLPGVNLPINYESKNPNKHHEKLNFLFFGNLRQNSDINLLNKLANLPNVLITIIGIIDESIVNDISKTIVFRGCVKQDKIFDISSTFDGILLPYKKDMFSSTISPAKFFECLAMNRMIITRSKLKIFDGYEDYMLQIDDLDKLNYHMLQSALDHYRSNPLSRAIHTEKYTWEERLKGLDKFLQKELKLG